MHPSILSSLVARVSLAPRWRLVLGLGLPPLAVAAVLAGVLLSGGPSTPAGPTPAAPGGAGAAAAAPGDAEAGTSLPAPAGLLVDVTGAVARPGVYRVAKGDRASAAIATAGGLTSDADPNRLPNMAGLLKDGQQVKVPALGTPVRSSSTTGSTRVVKVSLNAATAEQLAAVPGFTQELAAAVITYRTEYGGFASTRELVDVLDMSQADYVLAQRYVSI